MKECLGSLHSVDNTTVVTTMSALLAEVNEALEALLHIAATDNTQEAGAAAGDSELRDDKGDAVSRLVRLYVYPSQFAASQARSYCAVPS